MEIEDGCVAVADAPPLELAGESQRAPASGRDHGQASEDVRQPVRELRAAGLTLREGAAAIGVSHETAPAILREAETALAAN